MTVPAAVPIKADRLKELRAFTMLLSHRCANNIRPDVGEAAAIEDLRALIDSALQPASTGEIGECPEDAPNGVFGRTDLPNVTVYTVRASAIGGFENDIGYWQMVMFGAHQRALDALATERDELLVSLGKQLLAKARIEADAASDEAALSHPGEQQLREALAEAREIVTNFVGIAKDNGINQRKYVSFGVRVNKFLTDSAALTAHKASDVPTAGDAALREAAKAGSKALRYLSGPNNSPTEREYSAHAQLLERFAEGSHG